VKALDSGVLLALLEGSPKAQALLRKLRGIEVATTEVNLLELAFLARGSRKVMAARLATLEKLRQRLTVVPLDARGSREVLAAAAGASRPVSPTVAAMLGALRAVGCEEILSDVADSLPEDWGVRVRSVTVW
jgi:predicted nucleic acid-binding protein